MTNRVCTIVADHVHVRCSLCARASTLVEYSSLALISQLAIYVCSCNKWVMSWRYLAISWNTCKL